MAFCSTFFYWSRILQKRNTNTTHVMFFESVVLRLLPAWRQNALTSLNEPYFITLKTKQNTQNALWQLCVDSTQCSALTCVQTFHSLCRESRSMYANSQCSCVSCVTVDSRDLRFSPSTSSTDTEVCRSPRAAWCVKASPTTTLGSQASGRSRQFTVSRVVTGSSIANSCVSAKYQRFYFSTIRKLIR